MAERTLVSNKGVKTKGTLVLDTLSHCDSGLLADAVHYEHIAGGRANFTIALFGKTCGGLAGVDWRLPILNPAVRNTASRILRTLGAQRYYAPNASQPNAECVVRRRLTKRVPMDLGIEVYGNPEETGEITHLESGEGLILNTAGCGVALAEYGDACVSHVGWGSLIDDTRLLNRTAAWRRHASVADAIVGSLKSRGAPRGIRVWPRGFIDPPHVHFPLAGSPWAELNTLRYRQMSSGWKKHVTVADNAYTVDMARLFCAQLRERGVNNIDISDRYVDRRKVWLNGAKGAPRNLLVVVRH